MKLTIVSTAPNAYGRASTAAVVSRWPTSDEPVEGARGLDSPPPPPPPIPGLGRPETTRKEAWWERAITWLLSRGEG